jgi:hypothetical protein
VVVVVAAAAAVVEVVSACNDCGLGVVCVVGIDWVGDEVAVVVACTVLVERMELCLRFVDVMIVGVVIVVVMCYCEMMAISACFSLVDCFEDTSGGER